MTTVALIHGGGSTSSCWDRVVPPLDGEVILVELPGRGRRPGNVPDVRASVLEGSGGGVFRIDDETCRQILGNDLDEEQSEWALAGRADETTSILAAPVDLTGIRSGIPVRYLRLLRDETLPPEEQDAAIAALGSPEVIEFDSGHMAMIARPEELAAVINDVAAR